MSIVTGLPDIVSVQKRVYPLLFTDIVSYQPTTQPIATAYGFKLTDEQPDDGSGWRQFQFTFDRWQSEVESNKLKTEVSTETLQDMASLGLPETVVTDNLADQIAEDINKDIVDRLIKISSIGYDIIIDDSVSKFEQGRSLYGEVHTAIAEIEKNTGITGSYLVAGGRAFNLLLSSSFATKIDDHKYKLTSGVILVHDKNAIEDYIVIGVKKLLGDVEISSLVYSPYDFEKGVDGLAYQVTSVDSKSLHPIVGVISRAAITAAPMNSDQTGYMELDWENLDSTILNSSKLSVYHTIS